MNQASQSESVLWAIARRLLSFVAIFFVGLVTSPLFGLFFWPQTALAPYGFTKPADDTSQTYLAGGPNYAITITFWLVVGLLLSWSLRRKPVRVTALATIPVTFLVAVIATILLSAVDIGIYYEGP